MKKLFPFLMLCFLSSMISAQFEQKISINLSAGVFNTLGKKDFMPDYGSTQEDLEPFQMSNYMTGFITNVGIQYNTNRHISIQAGVSVMHSGKWFYDIGEGVNYTEYRIWNPDNEEELLEKGHNELTLRNVDIGIAPRYYLFPGKRVTPFLFAGISLNLTSATFDDNEWNAYRELDMLEPDDNAPDRANIESNTGLGFYPGIGLEINISDRLGFHISSEYHYILLKEENFRQPEQHENLQAIILQAGLRFSFVKSKDI